MLSSFDYRGPSGQGIYKYRNVTLGHLGTEGRLYIIDYKASSRIELPIRS